MDIYEESKNENIEQEVTVKRPDHRLHRREKDPNRYFVLRNWLNTFFILGAIVGMCVYFFGSREVGTYVVMASMVLKFVECVFRVLR